MPIDKEFSLLSTSIAQNPESDSPNLKLSKAKSEKFLFQNHNLSTNAEENPLNLLKNALKMLQLNSSQQHFIITHVQQFQQQNNKSKNIRTKSSLKRLPSMESKKKPPLAQSRLQSKEKLKSVQQRIISSRQISQLKTLNFLEPDQIWSQSSILKTSEESLKLLGFFPENTVKRLALVFKASEHKFNLKQFFKLCGSSQNLLIICQTNKSKIIGAFSRLSHEFTGKNGSDDKWGQKVRDPTNESFIFSLTNGHKFCLNSQEYAIYRWRDKKYLVFGEWQFSLCDGANINKNSRTDNINLNYLNEEYKNSKESWIKLNGNEDPWFTVKEWEAWKVEFKTLEK